MTKEEFQSKHLHNTFTLMGKCAKLIYSKLFYLDDYFLGNNIYYNIDHKYDEIMLANISKVIENYKAFL